MSREVSIKIFKKLHFSHFAARLAIWWQLGTGGAAEIFCLSGFLHLLLV